MKKFYSLLTVLIICVIGKAQVPSFTITNISESYTLTCNTTTISLSVAPVNYTYSWVNSPTNFTSNATIVNLSNGNVGNYTVTATDTLTGVSSSQTFAISQNTLIPSSTLTPLSQIITCNSVAPTFTNFLSFPLSNVTTYWFNPGSSFPNGFSAISSSTNSAYNVLSPGTATLLIVNTLNGCSSLKTVTVTSTSAFPSFNATSTTNFSLGCASPVNNTALCMSGATSTNGPVQYAFLPPSSTLAIPIPGTSFGAVSCTTTGIPGTWTLVCVDPISGCQTPVPVVISSNTTLPSVSASMITQTLSCANPTILALGSSTTANTNITWLIPAPVGPIFTPSVIIGTPTGPNTNTNSLNFYATYTVVASNTVTQCKATQTIQIYQNFSVTPCGTAGIKENILDINANIYPNSSTDNLFIELSTLPKNTLFTVFDLQGKLILVESINSSKQKINFNIGNGFYFYIYKLSCEQGGIKQGKLIIE
ncbi:MAG: T9SS type A sorting domain-containing protein [Bacteroidota bacterium]|nr:T9SS type A sorting domain-containing protein [Bacteroidota bacterium]